MKTKNDTATQNSAYVRSWILRGHWPPSLCLQAGVFKLSATGARRCSGDSSACASHAIITGQRVWIYNSQRDALENQRNVEVEVWAALLDIRSASGTGEGASGLFAPLLKLRGVSSFLSLNYNG
jgi:hypothetical protein